MNKSKKIPLFAGVMEDQSVLICQILGIAELKSAKDAEALFRRANMFEQSLTPIRINEDSTPKYITLADCHGWRGATLGNAPTTDRVFKENLFRMIKDRADNEFRKQKGS